MQVFQSFFQSILFFSVNCLYCPFLIQTSLFFQFSFLERGEQLFSIHCISCHADGKNGILPEKNLKKETLEALGINNKNSLFYQIMNGKNGMPAFGGRLREIEIEQIVSYIFKE